MANINEDVSFTIGAKDNTGDGISKAKAGLQGLAETSERVSSQMVAHWEKFKGAYVAVSAAITSVSATIKKAWDMAEKAAGYLEQMKILDALAAKYDTTAQDIVNNVKNMSDGLIGSSAAASVALGGLAKGLNPEMIYGLAKASDVLADVMGVTARDAFEQMASALEANKQKTLKLMLGVIDLKDTYGEASESWSEQRKQIEFYNLLMAKAAEITRAMGDEQDSMADKMERFKVQMASVQKEIGIVLIRGVMLATGIMQGFNAAVLGAIGVINKLAGSSDQADEAFRQMSVMAKEGRDNLELAFAAEEEWTKAKNRSKDASSQQAQSQGELEKTIKATSEAMLKAIPIVAKWEEARLKLADTRFQEILKTENATIASMSKGMGDYFNVLEKVYTARVEGEKAVAAALAKAGAKPEDVMKANLEALKQEQELQVKKLDSWKSYYDKLVAMHSKAVDDQKKKEEELKKIREDMHQQAVTNNKIQMDLAEKMAIAKGAAVTDESIRTMKLAELRRREYENTKLEGEARIKDAQSIQTEYASLTSEVTKAGEVYDYAAGRYVKANIVVKTSLESITDAQRKSAEWGEKVLSLQEEQRAKKEEELQKGTQAIKSLADEIKRVQTEMATATQRVNELSVEIGKIEKDIVLRVDASQYANATMAVRELNMELGRKEGKLSDSLKGGTKGDVTDQPGMWDWLTGGLSSGGWTTSGSYAWQTGEVPAGGYTQADLPGGIFAQGGVFRGGKVVPFANGGIFNRPTLFPMARGYGLMGEAGPEAVMPLSRGRDGKLGVKASGGGISFSPTINIVGSNKSPEQLAREIVKPLQAEMRRLELVSG